MNPAAVNGTAPSDMPIESMTRTISAGPSAANDELSVAQDRLGRAESLSSVHAQLVAVEREVLAPDEFVAEEVSARRLRAADRVAREQLALAQIHTTQQLTAQDREAQTRLARGRLRLRRRTDRWQLRAEAQESRQRLWESRALLRRRRLTDTSAQLATTLRSYRFVMGVLTLVIVAGVVWTSYGVAVALDGATPAPLFYGVEGLFSLPLLVIVWMQMSASRYGRLDRLRLLTPPRRDGHGRRPTPVAYVEVFLLVLTISVNVWPTLVGPFVPERFLVRFFPPVLILLAVVLVGVAAAMFSELLREQYVGVDPHEHTRLDASEQDAISLAYHTQHAVQQGQFAVTELDAVTGLPSVSAMQRRFNVRKATCQKAHDVLEIQHRQAMQYVPSGEGS